MLGYFQDHTYMGPDAEDRIAAAAKIATSPLTPLAEWLSANVSKST
jgi:hypothetical protein